MALVKCPECGKTVSDRATVCPHCGCPLSVKLKPKPAKANFLKCEECGHIIDHSMSECVNCGCPTPWDDRVRKPARPARRKSHAGAWVLTVLIVALLGFGAWWAWDSFMSPATGIDATVDINSSFSERVNRYEQLFPFNEGFAPVKQNGKIGYINTRGELVVACRYAFVGPFVNGQAIVADDDLKLYVINDKGLPKTLNHSVDIKRYADGFFAKRGYVAGWRFVDGKFTFHGPGDRRFTIDDSGREVSGMASIDLDADPSEFVKFELMHNNIFGETETLYGFKRADGTLVVPSKYSVLSDFANGVACAVIYVPSESGKTVDSGDGLYIFGYVDDRGNTTFTEAQKQRIEDFKRQLAEANDLSREQARLEEVMKTNDTIEVVEQIKRDTAMSPDAATVADDLETMKRERAQADKKPVTFNSLTDVFNYIYSHTFSGSSMHLRFKQDGLYVNGECRANAPTVLDYSESLATVRCNIPTGGYFTFKVNLADNKVISAEGDTFSAH